MTEPEICVTTEEMKDGEKMPKEKKRMAISDAENRMGFGPYSNILMGKYSRMNQDTRSA